MKLSTNFLNLFVSITLLVSSASATAEAAEEQGLEKRALYSTCDSWGTYTTGGFTVYQNLWGASSGTGSQCLEVTSYSNGVFAWSTSWTWSGGPYNVKSYDNVAYNFNTGVQLSTISSIPSTWSWTQTGTSPINNVAYDLMTGSTSSTSATHEYEIMIWLAAFNGAGPISSSGSAIATPSIAGYSWKLFDGYNGSMRVFSFVASSNVNNFSGDLNLFLKYLATNNGLSSSQYLVVLQGGTEPFTGSNVVLTTSKYSVALNTGATATSTTRTSTTTTRTSTTTTASSSGTAPIYGQCGGQNWTGPTTCASGSTCVYSNAWYSQCIPS